MTINALKLCRLHMQELHGFLREVLSQAHNLLPGKEEQPMVEQLGTAVEEYSTALRQDITNSVTPALQQAGLKAEEAIRFTRNYIKALCNAPVASTATIARHILDECFYRYSDPSGLNQNAKSGMYTHILGRLEKWPAEEKRVLDLECWIERMRDCYTQYTELREAYTAEAITNITGLKRATREKAEQAYRRMVITINALITLYGEETYAEFAATLNTIIAQKKAVIAARRTRRENEGNSNEEECAS